MTPDLLMFPGVTVSLARVFFLTGFERGSSRHLS